MAGELKAERYELEAEVGRGGMGVVYRARDIRLGRTVALKMLPPELLGDPERRRRLTMEARASSAVVHPCLATVYDFEDRGDEVFIVYEFVEGCTLRESLHQTRWNTDAVLRLGIELADGLAAAHERGIIHRDLKPENIMLKAEAGRAGQVKILDFGLAKFRKPLRAVQSEGETYVETATLSTAAGLLVGTVNYMAPELLEGEVADARADIFSLGVVLYEAAAGLNPFAGKTPSLTIANLLKQDATPLHAQHPSLPPEFDRIVHKCLRKRREERFQSARELEVDLSNLRNDLHGSATRAAAFAAPRLAESPGIVPRGTAKALFTLMQAVYLVMYSAALYKWDTVMNLGKSLLRGNPGEALSLLVLLVAMVGTPVRLYLLSALVVNYTETGLKFRKLFPFVLFLDLLWALSALMLYGTFKGLTMAFAAVLAYLPFAARRLLYEVYSPRGGRTSGITPTARF